MKIIDLSLNVSNTCKYEITSHKFKMEVGSIPPVGCESWSARLGCRIQRASPLNFQAQDFSVFLAWNGVASSFQYAKGVNIRFPNWDAEYRHRRLWNLRLLLYKESSNWVMRVYILEHRNTADVENNRTLRSALTDSYFRRTTIPKPSLDMAQR